MSEPLVVSIPHRLVGKDEALRRLKAGLAQVGTTSSSLPTITVCPVLLRGPATKRQSQFCGIEKLDCEAFAPPRSRRSPARRSRNFSA